MYNEAHIDWETRSTTDLPKAGVYRYVEDLNTDVWVLCYRFDDGPVCEWYPGWPEPTELLDHVAHGRPVKAHNSVFERLVWNVVMKRKYPHWPTLTIAQLDCTMARAAAISHPQQLEKLAAALQTDVQKDMQGSALMKKMCRPRKHNLDGTITWWDAPADQLRLGQYCGTDVLTECAVDVMLPPLTPYERKVWELDQLINERGICIDVVAAEKCVVIVELAKKAADRVMRRLTNQQVPKCTNDAKLIQWITSRGIECTTVKKGEQEDLIFMANIAGEQDVEDAINLRADSKKTSTAKYKAMLLCVCVDGRIRGMLNYHGAGPGRWAGRGPQFQNFPRVDHEKEGWIFDWLIDLMHGGWEAKDVYDAMVAVHGETGKTAPMRLMSRGLRSMICAPAGKKLVGGDFSNIEGRVNAWNAGEQWKLDAFAEYDAGIGPDLYNVAYAKSFNVGLEAVGKDERQIGKVEELALGYQGSVGAFITMGDTYGLNPYEVSKAIKATANAELWDGTAALYEHAKNKEGLQENEWTAIKIIVDGWRRAHPHIVQSWWDLQDAAIEAVQNPGILVPCTKITYYSDGRCLWCVLPSGRMICYAYPEIVSEPVEMIDKYGQPYIREKHKVMFWGFKEGMWRRLSLYGGMQCENIVQGTARCIMVDRMFAVEEKGYPIILTVHDELLTEVEASRLDLNAEDFESVMSVLPQWATGLPLAAKAWEDQRYVK